jgi:hypothetical protein
MAADTIAVIEPIGISGTALNSDQVNMLKSFCSQAVDNWIKDKKGNLESQMPAAEDQKVHYKFNYEKGLAIINRILEVFPQSKDLLRLGLYYANCWNEDHCNCTSKDVEDIVAGSKILKDIVHVIKSFSNRFADELAPMCQSGSENNHLLENQEIARHYYFKAMVENQSKPFSLIDLVLRWDSSHDKILWFYANKYVNDSGLSQTDKQDKLKQIHKRSQPGTKLHSELSGIL